MGEEDIPQESAKFNMALDTLRRIGLIFEQIKNLYLDDNKSNEIKQATKLQLVKQLFIQASPLLSDTYVSNNLDKVLKLKPKRVKTYEKNGGGSTNYIGESLKYDQDLDIKLDTIIIELQQTLQEKQYFMPPNQDTGMF